MTRLTRKRRQETLVERIKYKYWGIVPYNWRPGQMWYRFTCWGWKRYTTVKPRYLTHTWSDRTELLPHMMFEILSDFVENECSPGIVEWYGEFGNKIEVNGKEVYARDEMQELYDWWHEIYRKEYKEVNEMLWAEAHKHSPIDWDEEIEPDDEAHEVFPNAKVLYEWKQEFKTEEDDEIYTRCLNGLNKLEKMQDEELEENMQRLVKLRMYLWT